MGSKSSDTTGLYECINHPGRLSPRQQCISAERDGLLGECTCCDECRAMCVITPHGHGGTPDQEWEGNYCKLCGEDISRWLPKP